MIDHNLSLALHGLTVLMQHDTTDFPELKTALNAIVNAKGIRAPLLLYHTVQPSMITGNPAAIFQRTDESFEAGIDELRIMVEIDLSDRSLPNTNFPNVFNQRPIVMIVQPSAADPPIRFIMNSDGTKWLHETGKINSIRIGSFMTPLLFPRRCTPKMALQVGGLVVDGGGCDCDAGNGLVELELVPPFPIGQVGGQRSTYYDEWFFNSYWLIKNYIPGRMGHLEINTAGFSADLFRGFGPSPSSLGPDVLQGEWTTGQGLGASSMIRYGLCSSPAEYTFVNGVPNKYNFSDKNWSDFTLAPGIISTFGPCIWQHQNPSITLVET